MTWAVTAAICTAWLVAVAAQLTETGRLLHHDALIEGTLPLGLALALFVLAWQAMIAAMMLPSSLPLMRLFAIASAQQPAPRRAMAAFLGGYVVVWTAFGILAFLGDTALHRIVDATPWLEERPWLIAGGVILLAGAFQFSPLKDRCLRVCRAPGAFLIARYRRGVSAAFALGRGHGLLCVGCCWALMLVTFAAGVANLWWMAVLAALMTYEKTGRHGRRVVPVAGATLLALGALLLMHPAWLPANPF
jgi:predicted metal-binding membrane protein